MNNARRTGIFILTIFTVLLLTSGGGSDKNKTSSANDIISADDIMDLPPLKDQFSAYFMMGNIFNPADVRGTAVINTNLTRHYNVLTAENHMKPDNLSTSQGSYNFTTADRMVKAAIASGFKVVGHTLLWHSQIPAWQRSISQSTALNAMKKYITDVVTHFKGDIYSWDVLNEAFPDGGYGAGSDWKKVMRSENPWYKALGADFVYEGFLAARLADPAAILYYNDYNLDSSTKAAMVYNMVRDINEQYLTGGDKPAGEAANRLLIEGIGMQSHHNTNVQANSIRNSLEKFKTLGVKIAISELDVLAQGYSSTLDTGPRRSPAIGNNLALQATRYGEYMTLYLQYADIIERVSFWGVTDIQSWRSAGQPLLFDLDGYAKEAYYKIIEALGK